MATFTVTTITIMVMISRSFDIMAEQRQLQGRLNQMGWTVFPIDIDLPRDAPVLCSGVVAGFPAWPMQATIEGKPWPKKVTKEEITILSKMRYVRSATVAACDLDREGCMSFSLLSGLRMLNIERCRLSTPLSTLASNIALVESFVVDGVSLDADDWRTIANMPRVAILSARNCGFNDEAAESLKASSIQSLIIERDNLTNRGVAAITSIGSLRRLEVVCNTSLNNTPKWRESKQLHAWRVNILSGSVVFQRDQ